MKLKIISWFSKIWENSTNFKNKRPAIFANDLKDSIDPSAAQEYDIIVKICKQIYYLISSVHFWIFAFFILFYDVSPPKHKWITTQTKVIICVSEFFHFDGEKTWFEKLNQSSDSRPREISDKFFCRLLSFNFSIEKSNLSISVNISSVSPSKDESEKLIQNRTLFLDGQVKSKKKKRIWLDER